ncbi:ribosomal protein S18-alanine N-acetyltransferase [Longimicrobium sp.]|uniref:ribosomal protein S18-alanine N-acetyltransferase n=1 Tax=Longimicrobium sp. TaxID=2029185 RepID=UPI002BE51E12|nr:ribosomal protein S18-alanine N-acetyltransferase [Longimicrobium sp.]HSU13024.1 ribosomal protein S18-alanine N-acetyltransferase [Longimicrobium sp.]
MARVDVDAPFGLMTEPSFRIRPMHSADLPRVLEIEIACFSTPWKDATFRGLMRRTDTDLYVAELEDRIVGYAACWTVIDQSELGNVAVAPEARGQGIGGALVEMVIERVKERGARELFLEVRESNLGAQSIYRVRGFTVVGRRRSYYAQPTEDALVMRLRV